ncbi:MAG: peptide synthetase, partial [Aeromicrobium sp.]
LAGTALRTVFPVHSRNEDRWHDSVGWFITNAVLESEDTDPAACSAAVKEAIRLGSWPLADVMAPWGGMPEAPGMFAVSWLDMRRLPVRIDTAGLDAQYVSAAITTSNVMLWFIIDDSGVHLRCRYPDTQVARLNVGAWLDTLVARMRELAAGGTTSVAGARMGA